MYANDGCWGHDVKRDTKVPADDVTLHQYGACNICRNFGVAFYVMVSLNMAPVLYPGSFDR